MSRVAKPNPTGVQILEWFELGNVGSAAQIAEVVGAPENTVSMSLKQLARNGMAKVIDRTIRPNSRGRTSAVWGECEVTFDSKPVNVMAVIASQPDIVKIWNGMVV